ncbi:MAG: hypothetical protein N2689_06335, partial [Verrucomicrobiae bacterium]|nr:hypothetical protein [Verrucomicrobiae bacterium]
DFAPVQPRYNHHRVVCSLLTCATVWLGTLATGDGAEKLLLIKSRDLPQYTQAAQGVLTRWKSLGQPHVVTEHLLADITAAPAALKPPPAAIVAVGSEAACWAIERTDRPVVFCMVANAHQNVLPRVRVSRPARVAGVSLDLPVRTQFEAVRAVLPNVRRVGVLFDPTKSAEAVNAAKNAAASLGLELVVRPVRDASALPDATAWIASRIDLLWAPVDSTVYESRNAQFVLSHMLHCKVPVFGFSENMVRAGALLAPRMDYEGVGRQTAELLHTVLKNAAPAAPLLHAARDFELVVNDHVNRLVGKLIARATRHKVSFIYED